MPGKATDHPLQLLDGRIADSIVRMLVDAEIVPRHTRHLHRPVRARAYDLRARSDLHHVLDDEELTTFLFITQTAHITRLSFTNLDVTCALFTPDPGSAVKTYDGYVVF